MVSAWFEPQLGRYCCAAYTIQDQPAREPRRRHTYLRGCQHRHQCRTGRGPRRSRFGQNVRDKDDGEKGDNVEVYDGVPPALCEAVVKVTEPRATFLGAHVVLQVGVAT